MARPNAPWPVPGGCTYVAAEAASEWRVQTPEQQRTQRCRAGAGQYRTACGASSVAALNRGRHSAHHGRTVSWWAYCAEHAYGRWVEDGKVLQWRLVEAHIVEGVGSATLFVGAEEKTTAVAWGPTVTGDWVVRVPPNEGYRVAGRDAALAELRRIGGLS